MIRSMTGFGEAQGERDGWCFHVELRSVNNRYFKATVRADDEFAFAEAVLEQLLRARLTRGTVTLRLHVRNLSASAAQDVNIAAIEQYVLQLLAVAGSDARLTVDLATLALLPGVCQPHELSPEQRQRCLEAVVELAQQAIDALLRMRSSEGQALAEDLRAQAEMIRRNVEQVRLRAPQVIREYRERLRGRVQQLIGESTLALAEEAIVREVAVYAERSDISEELTRLSSHLDQFEECIVSDEPAGRKLEFIAQELQREANTIASKAGDAEIARCVIEIKGAIDRIREQVANVE